MRAQIQKPLMELDAKNITYNIEGSILSVPHDPTSQKIAIQNFRNLNISKFN